MASEDGPQTGFSKDVQSTLANISGLIKASLGPVHAQYPYQPNHVPEQAKGHFLADLKSITGYDDVKTLLDLFYDKAKGVQDDNTLLLERLVKFLSGLPANSKNGKLLTDGFINDLWASIPHPPITSLATKYKFRHPDGGNNNIDNPDLGRANTAYARSARPVTLQNIGRPTPEDLFDTLLVRGDKFEPHPNGVSSMLFYLASIIIHDLFRTDHSDYNNSLTSSYLDLAPLYGSNWEEQKTMRTFKDGKIKPDSFSEKRLLGFPPGVGAFLVTFNRYHNSIVDRLAVINENGRFDKPQGAPPDTRGAAWTKYDGELGIVSKSRPDSSEAAWIKYDHDLFNTARLINCGLYVNIILKDYVRTILSLNRTGTTWDLDPRTVENKTLLLTPAAEGVGNQVSAEFNLIYRWHSAVSEKDDKWTQEEYERLGIPANAEGPAFLEALSKWAQGIDPDPQKRTFGALKREPDGRYNDDDLVAILTSSIEDVAGSFGANKVPKILRSVELLGIIQARSWNLASLNEFREFFGLTKHTTFEDINPDPVVVEKLKNLYDAPDSVELYPGLVIEKAKPPKSPGSGLCVNYTISRAILSDAVALVRGDRFYTADYTPRNLTNWGFTQVDFDLTVDEGGVVYKLFYNAFPSHFKGNSIYAHFPFVIPSENKAILNGIGRANLYDWSQPKRVPDLKVVSTYKAATRILGDKETFKVTWGETIAHLVKHPDANYGVNYCLAGDGPKNAESRKVVVNGLYPKRWQEEVKSFYQDITTKLLKQNSYKIGRDNQVDIVRDVAALGNTNFSAKLFSLPLKTEDHPHGIYTEQQLYQVLSILFTAIFYDIDPSNSFLLQNAANQLTKQLGDLCLFNVEAVSNGGIMAKFISKLHETPELSDYGVHMIQRLLESGLSINEVVWTNLVPTAASMVANQTQLFAQALDYYLGDGKKHLKELNRLAKLDTPEADELILRYFLEGSRLRGTAGLFRDAAVDVEVEDGSKTIKIPKGHRLLVNMVAASLDPTVFPEPNEVKLDRDIKSYIHYGWGPHQCAGIDTSKVALSTMFKTVMKLENVRRAPGLQGELKRIPAPFGYTIYMKEDWSGFYPIPTTMKIRWD